MDDLISRQAAIDAIHCDITVTERQNAELVAATIGAFADRIKALPSAQPEKRTEERMETHACDLIDRQAAIDAADAVWSVTGDKNVAKVWDQIKDLSSAQPQTCDDAISREDAKWVVFCNRDHVEDQANAIDSLPCVQPSAQPEIIRCKDCKWYGRVDKRRFYRGMDCLQKHIDTIVPDRDFCSKAERRGEQDG